MTMRNKKGETQNNITMSQLLQNPLSIPKSILITDYSYVRAVQYLVIHLSTFHRFTEYMTEQQNGYER
jgi:hypothetical protein